tara:strand:- start:5064 stop:5744 length:681 start_codon:yes stop_codon:yes gene_type:complete
MKKIIIATSVLFAFSSVFAQKPNVKPEVTKYQSKTSDAKPSSKPAPVSIQAKPNAKPVGKPAAVVSKVSPIKPTKSMAPSKNRASGAPGGNVNVKTPTKLETKEKNTISKSRASSSSVGKANDKTPAKLETKEKNTISKSRASQSAVGTDKKNPSAKLDSQSSAVVGDSKSPEMDADYCKGWKDGFSKAIPEGKKARVAKCEINGTCKGYKCGYEAGMKKAELMFK